MLPDSAHRALANPTKTEGFKADGCTMAAIGFVLSIVLLEPRGQTYTYNCWSLEISVDRIFEEEPN